MSESPLDESTRALIVLAAATAQGEQSEIRDAANEAVAAGVSPAWGDELILQSVLIVGWPRALMAAGQWRAAIGQPAVDGESDLSYTEHYEWTRRGEETCSTIYGDNYARLRDNVYQLHPALDAWMLTEAYGRTLSRPGLDLVRRELCVIAQTAVLNTPRQLH
ncbi:MAG TPA: carboxymuconolactone decarboxylase family protein, partial [Gemmatimonadales bacterium]|nr:carboxymuconolactone decarboxylase family protein [Gemmatimonadales bacterium]